MEDLDGLCLDGRSSVEVAIDTVADAIAGRVSQAMEPRELKVLAEAAALLKFGTQGMTDYRYRSDVHETHHEGEKRRHEPTGFRDGPDG